MNKQCFLALLPVWAAFLFPVASQGASTPISGNQSGTLHFTNSPFLVTGDIVVPQNQTLTIEAGCVLQFTNTSIGAFIDGTLIARGTSLNPILFTSDKAVKQPGQWKVLDFRATGGTNSILESCIVESAAASGYAANIQFENEGVSAAMITNCVIRNSAGHGITFYNSDARIQNCVLSNNQAFAISMKADSLPVLRNNSAQANGQNAIEIYGNYVGRSGAWVRDSLPYSATADLYVNNGVTLTLEPGITIQFTNVNIGAYVNGTLIARGTSNSPILFTSDKPVKQPGQWKVLDFAQTAGTNSILENCIVECAAGNGYTANIQLENESTSGAVVTNCVIRNSAGHGITFYNSDARIQNCALSNNHAFAISMKADCLPVLRNNSALNNGQNAIEVYGTYVTRNGAWVRDSLPYSFTSDLYVNSGVTLTLEAGTTMQFTNVNLGAFVNGTLIARGTSNNPILFTSDKPVKQPGQWKVLDFSQTGGTNSILENCVVECGAAPAGGYAANIQLENESTAGAVVTNCVIRNSAGHGITFYNSDARIQTCVFSNNQAFAISMKADCLPVLRNNSAQNNGLNFIEVYGSYVTRSGAWVRDNLPYSFTSDLYVNSGVTLTLEAGTTMQFTNVNLGAFVNGTLIARGTSNNPILFTSDKPVKQPGQWKVLDFSQTGGTNSILETCIVECAAAPAGGYAANIQIDNEEVVAVTITNCIIRSSATHGIGLGNSDPQIQNCVFSNNLAYAISMRTDCLPSVRNNSALGNGKNAIEVYGSYISRSGTWVRDSLPYSATADTYVNNGVTLTIEPGTTVQFTNANVGAYIAGTLIARGTSLSPITFTSDKPVKQPGQWRGMDIQSSAGAGTILESCVLEAGAGGLNANLQFDSAPSLLITNCIFRNSLNDGVYCTAASPRLSNCRFLSNGRDGLRAVNGSSPVVTNSAIIGNTNFGVNNLDTSRIIVAEGNYWGDPRGPYDNSNVDGRGQINTNTTGDHVSEYVDWSHFLAADPAATSGISVSPTNLAFGSVNVGQTNQMSFVISNLGNTNLTINSITTSNPSYSLASPLTPFSVPVGSHQAVMINFAPLTGGPLSGTLSISNSDPIQPNVAVAISGTGIAAASPAIVATPTNLNFGTIPVGLSVTLSVTVSNAGTTNLTVSSLTVSNSSFAVIGPSTPFSVVPGGQQAIDIQFAPSTAGNTNGTLAIASNDPRNPILYIALSGSGMATMVTNCPSLPSGCVGWWPGNGNANDIVAGDNGSTNGGVVFAAGKVAQSFGFSGPTASVSIPDTASLRPASVTIEAWVKFDSLNASNVTAGFQYIVCKNWDRGGGLFFTSYGLGKELSGGADRLLFMLSTGSSMYATNDLFVQSTTIVTTGQWYHVAGTYDATNINLYVNGSLEFSSPYSSPLIYDTSPLLFGTSGHSPEQKFQGELDEVSIYNRALSASEIAAIYVAGSAGKCSPANTSVSLAAAKTGSNQLVVSWPTSAVGFSLQYATNLPAASNNWLAVTDAPAASGGYYKVTNNTSVGRKFYRLIK